jgi:uncharacterized protein YeaO (DUF488 family)
MLSRYKIYRGKRPDDDPLPDGIRQDSRKHTRHCLRPPTELVERYLGAPGDEAWKAFQRDYFKELDRRFADDPAPFDELAALAGDEDVYIGCNCPTRKNPDPSRCHTILALRFMARKFRSIEVRHPIG